MSKPPFYYVLGHTGRTNMRGKRTYTIAASTVVHIDSADSLFTELSEKVDSLQEISNNKPFADAVLVATVKRYLSEPKFRIKLQDLVVKEREFLYTSLFGNLFQSDAVPTPAEIAKRTKDYELTVRRMCDVIIAGCYYGENDHAPLWIESVERVAGLPGPQPGYELWMTLRRYPALLLIYAGGLAAIAAGNYSMVLRLLTQPKFRIGNREHLLLERVNAVKILDVQFARTLPNMERRKTSTPMSQYLEALMREPLSNCLPDDQSYRRVFDRFEYMLAMIFIDQTDRGWAPLGCFAWRYEMDDESSPAKAIANEIAGQGEEWPPLKAGMFGGQLPRLSAAKAKLDEFITQVAAQLAWQ